MRVLVLESQGSTVAAVLSAALRAQGNQSIVVSVQESSDLPPGGLDGIEGGLSQAAYPAWLRTCAEARLAQPPSQGPLRRGKKGKSARW